MAEILGFLTVGLARAARRRADLSQRAFAEKVGVHHGTIAKIEAGERLPSLGLFVRLMRAAGLQLVVVDEKRRQVQPMEDYDDVRNLAGRRFPTHQDLIFDPDPGEWWGDCYGLARPPETFHRDKIPAMSSDGGAAGRCVSSNSAVLRRRRSGASTTRCTSPGSVLLSRR